MKIFLSWSGTTSRAFAHKFQEFIGQVLPWADIYLSDDEIESGERWLDNISSALEGSSYGIIFLTNENKIAPWVLFEAGALSKRISDSRVVPLLCDIDDIDLTGNPLSQFQYRKLNKSDIERLLKDINSKSDVTVPWDRLVKTIDKFWPDYEPDLIDLQKASAEAQKAATQSSTSRSRSSGKVDVEQLHESLNEILRAVRGGNRDLVVPARTRNALAPEGLPPPFLPENTIKIDLPHDGYIGELDIVRDRARLVSKSDGSIVVRYHQGLSLSPSAWADRFMRSITRLENRPRDE